MIRELLGGPHDGFKTDIDPEKFNWIVVVDRKRIYPIKELEELCEHDEGVVYEISFRDDKYIHVYSHVILGVVE